MHPHHHRTPSLRPSVQLVLVFFGIFLTLVPLVHFWHYPCRLLPSQMEDLRRLLTRVSQQLEIHHVPYTLYEGTLLGMVREGDLIPWDTDVDLAVRDVDQDAAWAAVSEPMFADYGVPLKKKSAIKVYDRFRYAQPGALRLLYKRTYVDIMILNHSDPKHHGFIPFPGEEVPSGAPSVVASARTRSHPAASGAAHAKVSASQGSHSSLVPNTITSSFHETYAVPADMHAVLVRTYGETYMLPDRANDGGFGYNNFAEACPHISVAIEVGFLILAVLVYVADRMHPLPPSGHVAVSVRLLLLPLCGLFAILFALLVLITLTEMHGGWRGGDFHE